MTSHGRHGVSNWEQFDYGQLECMFHSLVKLPTTKPHITCQDNIVNPDIHVLKRKKMRSSLRWRHNDRDGVSNHQPHECLLNRLFRRRLKKISKFRVTGLCAGNSSVTGGFPAQRVNNAENVSIWWRHHDSEKSVRDTQGYCVLLADLKILFDITK